jgi:hypothetical protein
MLSAVYGTMGARFLLLVFGPLPLFLAGFGWGFSATLVAVATGAVVAGLLGYQFALVFLLGLGLPAIILVYLSLLYRPARATDIGERHSQGEAVRNWLPAGHLIAGTALVAGGLAAMNIAFVAWDIEALRKLMREFISQMIQRPIAGVEPIKMTPEEIAAFANVMISKLPVAMALMWFITLIVNLWVAGRVSLSSGRLPRPWPALSEFQLPAALALALALSLGASMIDGLAGMLGDAVSTACLAAYVLQGLAILHYVTRGRPWRGFALGAVYAVLTLTGAWGAYAVALIGLAEPISPLNRSRRPQPG